MKRLGARSGVVTPPLELQRASALRAARLRIPVMASLRTAFPAPAAPLPDLGASFRMLSEENNEAGAYRVLDRIATPGHVFRWKSQPQHARARPSFHHRRLCAGVIASLVTNQWSLAICRSKWAAYWCFLVASGDGFGFVGTPPIMLVYTRNLLQSRSVTPGVCKRMSSCIHVGTHTAAQGRSEPIGLRTGQLSSITKWVHV